ncbi:MAG: formyltetrahydrofolate deformylase [Rickettsiales bacterium]|nr:formyltetrahydrofolate deformylase [Rickettsiales bacterium]
MTQPHYILTLSCNDVRGIVAAVTNFLADNYGFIIESAQHGDASTGRFFLRIEFSAEPHAPNFDELKARFDQQIAQRFSMQWQITDRTYKSRVLIMVSKYGHCLNDLLYRYSTGQLAIQIPAIVSNHTDWQKAARWHDVPFYHLPVTAENKDEQEKTLLSIIERERIDVVVLARYMQILSPELCSVLQGKAINIHHSFLPSFKGAKPYSQAFERGVKLIGATAHYVTTDLDEGPIIEQEVARVDHTHQPEDLEAIGRDIECQVLARALRYHAEQRVLLNGKKTVVFR